MLYRSYTTQQAWWTKSKAGEIRVSIQKIRIITQFVVGEKKCWSEIMVLHIEEFYTRILHSHNVMLVHKAFS